MKTDLGHRAQQEDVLVNLNHRKSPGSPSYTPQKTLGITPLWSTQWSKHTTEQLEIWSKKPSKMTFT